MFGLLDLPNRLRAGIVIRELNGLKAGRILDLGSGTGCYSFYLSRDLRLEVVGVEVDEGRISESSQIAKGLGRGNLKFLCGNATECVKNFSSGMFDAALAIEVLQYLSDVASILQETYRVLTPGGYLLGHVPVLGCLRPQERTLFNDDKIQHILSKANYQVVKIIPTFGGIPRKLCGLYDRLSRSRMAVGVLFPFILLASMVLQVENPNGDYRFFVARKPTDKETEERGLSNER